MFLHAPRGSLSGFLYFESIFSVRFNLLGCQYGNFPYTRICSTSAAMPFTSFRIEYVRCHETSSTKQFAPKISSQIFFKLYNSFVSILIKIAPSSANNFCSSTSLGYIIHSHLSCLDKSSPSLPTTSPSHFLILGSFTLSLYIHPSFPVL